MSEREARVEMVAGVLRDAVFRRGKNWLKAADEVLDALEAEYEYEYSVQFTLGGKKHPIPQWMSREDAEAWLNEGRTSGVHDAFGVWSKVLVKRRKAGKAEDV